MHRSQMTRNTSLVSLASGSEAGVLKSHHQNQPRQYSVCQKQETTAGKYFIIEANKDAALAGC